MHSNEPRTMVLRMFTCMWILRRLLRVWPGIVPLASQKEAKPPVVRFVEPP